MGTIDSFLLYLTVYLASAAMIHIGFKTKMKLYKIICLSAAIILPAFLAGIRYGVGTDFFGYRDMYRIYARVSLADQFKRNGFLNGLMIWGISHMAKYIGGEVIFFGLYAFLTYAIFIDALKYYGKINYFFIAFGFLMGPFTAGMNIMRQALAVSIIFWSLRFVYERKLGKYILMILVAFTAHSSAIVALPIYLLYSKWNGRKIWNIKAVAAVLGVAVAVAYLPLFFSYLTNVKTLWLSHYAMYSEEVHGNNYSFLLSLLLLTIILFFQKKLVMSEPKNRLLIVLFTIGVILEFSGYFSAYVKRISDYFCNGIDSILLFQIPALCGRKSKVLGYAVGFLYVILLFFLMYVVLGQADIIPYRIK